MCCECERSPDEDMDDMLMEMAERERELIDRAEAQKPDWLNVAKDLCLPSLAYTAVMEPRA